MTLVLALSVACWAVAPAPELIAHRGESHDAPENTLAAFQLAWQRQVTAIELDVHLTKDERLVCIHDADTKRTAGELLTIKSSPLDRLLGLDVGSWKGERWKGERLPTLEDALATIPASSRCLIEVKVGPEAVPALVRAVRDSGKNASQLAVISFKSDTLAEAKRQLPELPTYYVSGFKQDKATGEWRPSLDELIQEARAIGAAGLDLDYRGPVDQAAIQRVKAAGLQCYVWTVDEVDVARKLTRWGVSGITTNRAAFLREQLSKPGRTGE